MQSDEQEALDEVRSAITVGLLRDLGRDFLDQSPGVTRSLASLEIGCLVGLVVTLVKDLADAHDLDPVVIWSNHAVGMRVRGPND